MIKGILIKKQIFQWNTLIIGCFFLMGCLTDTQFEDNSGTLTGTVTTTNTISTIYLYKGDTSGTIVDSIASVNNKFQFDNLNPGTYSILGRGKTSSLHKSSQASHKNDPLFHHDSVGGILNNIVIQSRQITSVGIDLKGLKFMSFSFDKNIQIEEIRYFHQPILVTKANTVILQHLESGIQPLFVKVSNHPEPILYLINILDGKTDLINPIPTQPELFPEVLPDPYEIQDMKIRFNGQQPNQSPIVVGSEFYQLAGTIANSGDLVKVEISQNNGNTFFDAELSGGAWMKILQLFPDTNHIVIRAIQLLEIDNQYEVEEVEEKIIIVYDTNTADEEAPVLYNVNLKLFNPSLPNGGLDTTNIQSFKIVGMVDDESGAAVFVNDSAATLVTNNRWEYETLLNQGLNILEISAVDNSPLSNKVKKPYGIYYTP